MRELSMHVLDLIQNSLEASATKITLLVTEDSRTDRLEISLADNGSGMSDELARQALNPFYTSRHTRRVGLGLPLLAAAAERCDGGLAIESRPGEGTTVRVSFALGHIDRAPLGDMAGTLLGALLHVPPVRIVYRHVVNGREFEFDSKELSEELGDVPFSHPAVIRWLREFLAEGFADLYGGNANAQSALT